MSGIERFAKVCRNTGVHPQPHSIRFLYKKLPKLDLCGLGYSDADLLALTAAIPCDSGVIESVDLGDNQRLTDASVCVLMQAMAEKHSKTLQALSLHHCRQLGREFILLLTKLISKKFAALQILDMSGITIGLREYTRLAIAIGSQRCLRDVRMVDTGLGLFCAARESVIGHLVSNQNIEALDISWNSLDAAAFSRLGKGLVKHPKLHTLRIANTGPLRDPELNGSPLLLFLEFLAFDVTLTSLDISNNVLDQQSALVLECSACRHQKLSIIDISRNPLGHAGLRSVLRLVANPACPCLSSIALKDCIGGTMDGNCTGPYDGDPSGMYSLNLVQPAHRALLRMFIMRFCEGTHAIPPEKLMHGTIVTTGDEKKFDFRSLKLNPRTYSFEPSFGLLEFELCAGELIIDAGKGTLSLSPTEYVEFALRRLRINLLDERISRDLLYLIKSVDNENAWRSLLESASHDFVLTPDQVQGLFMSKTKHANCGRDLVGTCIRMLPCVIGATHQRIVLSKICSLRDMTRMQHRAGSLVSLVLDNPTGHYNLVLSQPCDRSVLERLLLLNRWEYHIWLTTDHSDISQHGNSKNFRNVMYSNRDFVWDAKEWRLPGNDTISFDYVSLRRPPDNATPITDECFCKMVNRIEMVAWGSKYRGPESDGNHVHSRHMLKKLGSTLLLGQCDIVELPLVDILRSFRSVSTNLWLRSAQLRKLLCAFREPDVCSDALVCCILRTVDWPLNGTMCRAKFARPAWGHIRQRLGYITTLCFYQPENTQISLDLAIHEQRLTLLAYTSLMRAEDPQLDNLKDSRMDWTGPNIEPNFEAVSSGLPPTWNRLDDIPPQGVFEAIYQCQRANVKVLARRKLAVSSGGWESMPSTDKGLTEAMMTWSVFYELPEDVTIWLRFLCARFNSWADAFAACDIISEDDFKVVTQGEHVTAIMKLGFHVPAKVPEERRKNIMIKHAAARELEGRRLSELHIRKDPAGARASITQISDLKAISDAETVFTKTKTEQMGTKRIATKRGSMLHNEKDHRSDAREMAVLHNVCKFLTLHMDSGVADLEFGQIAGMWRELKLCAWEFVCHVRMRFGSVENAWSYATLGTSKTLDAIEFSKLAQEWEFGGPVVHVFMMLDSHGIGLVPLDAWMMLDQFVAPQGSVVSQAPQRKRAKVASSSAGKFKATEFADFDKDNDGKISEAEFVAVGRLMDPSKSKADYKAMFASLDQDKDKGLNLEELAAFFSGTQDALMRGIKSKLTGAAYSMGGVDWHRLFDHYDRDGSGSVSLNEFRNIIRKDAKVTASMFPDEMLEHLFEIVDEDKSGKVAYREFLVWLHLEEELELETRNDH